MKFLRRSRGNGVGFAKAKTSRFPSGVVNKWKFNMTSWGFSSAGRASALHAEGQEFESPNLHHKIQNGTRYSVFYFAVLGMRTPKMRKHFSMSSNKPSRGTTVRERWTIIIQNHAFGFNCERCRLSRGAVTFFQDFWSEENKRAVMLNLFQHLAKVACLLYFGKTLK